MISIVFTRIFKYLCRSISLKSVLKVVELLEIDS